MDGLQQYYLTRFFIPFVYDLHYAPKKPIFLGPKVCAN